MVYLVKPKNFMITMIFLWIIKSEAIALFSFNKNKCGVTKLFDTKIAIVLLSSLKTWQKLNVTSFLTSGIIGQSTSLIGEKYVDKSNYEYLSLSRQPVVVLEADVSLLKKIHARILERSIVCSIYINDMFATGNDEANRRTVSSYSSEDLPLVGLALKEDKKIVDKVTKGAKLHSWCLKSPLSFTNERLILAIINFQRIKAYAVGILCEGF